MSWSNLRVLGLPLETACQEDSNDTPHVIYICVFICLPFTTFETYIVVGYRWNRPDEPVLMIGPKLKLFGTEKSIDPT